jgi:methyltransferase (TIGR00027 family)
MGAYFMKLPNPSYMMTVGKLRYIQSAYEAPEYQNPDSLVGELIPRLQRWGCSLQGRMRLPKLQLDPFYGYLIARTKYYDQVFLDAIHDEVACILNIGCGSDTRAYRFSEYLQENRISVLECDLPQAISAKEVLAGRKWRTDHVTYVPIDLNEGFWPALKRELHERYPLAAVIMEGVSPYINEEAFSSFLKFIANNVRTGSLLHYDYKLSGVANDFGRTSRKKRLFRLPDKMTEVTDYHEALGYILQHMEPSSQLSARLLQVRNSDVPPFAQDCILKLATA